MKEENLITTEQLQRMDKAFQLEIKTDEDLMKLAEILDIEEIDDEFTIVFPETARN